jgi:hypothetical protein
MKSRALLLVGLVGFAGCNGGDNSANNNNNTPQTIDKTSQFLAQTQNARYESGGLTFNFGSDSSLEMLINEGIQVQNAAGTGYDEANCNLRFTGKSAYYDQIATPAANGGRDISGPTLELTLLDYQLLSSKKTAPLPMAPTDPTGDDVCNRYAKALIARKTMDLSVSEYASDHIKIDYFEGLYIFSTPAADGSVSSIMGVTGSSSVGISDDQYFVKKGVRLDITNSFLKQYAGTLFTEEYVTTTATAGSVLLDAGLKELTVSYPRCGLKYFIDVQSVTTTGDAPLLMGQVSDSIVNPPVPTPTPTDGLIAPNCADVQAMLDGVSTHGIEVDGEPSLCTDNSCIQIFSMLRLGTPSVDPTTGEDKLIIDFKTAAQSSSR